MRALVDAGMRQLFRRKTAAPIHVEAVELSPHELHEFFFRHDAVLILSIKRIRFSTSLAPADQVRLLTAKADVDAITAATSPEIIEIFENFDMVLSSDCHSDL